MKNNFIFVLFACFIFSNNNFAQQDSTLIKKDSLDYYDMTLDQLMNLKSHGLPSELEAFINSLISVASKKPINLRESPGVISLVTEEEIKKSGARDLIDVLRLVPGFDFGVDVEGVVGIGIRGNWSHEGKVLILLDGQETNEILYACTVLGNHYPVEQIKKIEIIRGPGSAIYGGYAGYGVINIITKQGEDIKGLSVSGTYGQMEKTYGRRNLNLQIGQKIKDFQYSISGLIGQGNRSDQILKDYNGNSYNMSGNSKLNPGYANIGITYKGLSFKCIGDFFQTSVGLRYTTVNPYGAYTQNFNSIYSELKYGIKINDKVTITPKLNFKQQSPWQTSSKDSVAEGLEYNVMANRQTANVTGVINFNRSFNLVTGGEIYKDYAQSKSDYSTFTNGKNSVSYFNYAFYAQSLIKTDLVNIILGSRYDKHNIFGDAFVPRVGLTKKSERFHFKALYSNSFRAPSIENINSNESVYQGASKIKPELTAVLELELGYKLTRNSILTVNIYDITTKNAIVYYVDSALGDAYVNKGATGTQGIETEFRTKGTWGYFVANYSYYTGANKPVVDVYSVSDNPASHLGFANHRFNLNSSFNIAKGISINPSASLIGTRWGYAPSDTTFGVSDLKKVDPTLLLNFYIQYKTLLKGLTIGLGVYDLLNQKYAFIQPYNSDHPFLPGPSREIIFRLSYNFNYKEKSN